MSTADGRADRFLPGHCSRCFLRAAATEAGEYALLMMLQQTGLERFAVDGKWVAPEEGLRASELAGLQASMREYYGRGARGMLNRIGEAAWRSLLEDDSLGDKALRTLRRGLPRSARARQTLEGLARQMRGPDGDVSVHLLDVDLYLIDRTSDSTLGQAADEPICWVTMGMIEAALRQALGSDVDVEEVNCRAMGAEACKFRVRI